MNEEIKLLYVSKEIQDLYKHITNNNENLDELEIKKKLTRNFILGTISTKHTKNNIQVRYYGRLKLIVDIEKFRLLYIRNNKKIKNRDTYFINKFEKQKLNKLFGIREENTYGEENFILSCCS